jgi:hypothetical protein
MSTNSKDELVNEADRIFDELYEQVYTQIEFLTKRGALNIGTIDELIKIAMETVEFISSNRSKLSGTQKSEMARNVIIDILRDLAKKKKIDKQTADDIIAAINLIGPAVFKLIILAYKGAIQLGTHVKNKVKKGCATGCM